MSDEFVSNYRMYVEYLRNIPKADFDSIKSEIERRKSQHIFSTFTTENQIQLQNDDSESA